MPNRGPAAQTALHFTLTIYLLQVFPARQTTGKTKVHDRPAPRPQQQQQQQPRPQPQRQQPQWQRRRRPATPLLQPPAVPQRPRPLGQQQVFSHALSGSVSHRARDQEAATGGRGCGPAPSRGLPSALERAESAAGPARRAAAAAQETNGRVFKFF